MNLNLADKKVLVTGSSKGIGLEIARQFSREGCMVALNARSDINQDVVDSVQRSVSVIGDVSNERGAKKVVEQAVQELGGLDIVICNVGSGRSVRPGHESFVEWQKSFNSNFFSTTSVVEAARPFLKDRSSAIVCISSICGVEVIPGAPITYSVAKAALNAYVKGISRPLGEEGIRICAIAPGNMFFEGSVWESKVKEDPNSVSAMLDREVPLKKLGSPTEIASLTVFLASQNASYSTGAIWVADGGQTRSI